MEIVATFILPGATLLSEKEAKKMQAYDIKNLNVYDSKTKKMEHITVRIRQTRHAMQTLRLNDECCREHCKDTNSTMKFLSEIANDLRAIKFSWERIDAPKKK